MKGSKLLYCLICLIYMSCNVNEKKSIIITDISKPYEDVLYPSKNRARTYSSFYIDIKGKVNDSVFFEFNEGNPVKFYFVGNINKQLLFDYYGDSPQSINFIPYKATVGELKIEYGIY